MKTIVFGLLLMFIAVLMLLDAFNVLELGAWTNVVWAVLVLLVGLEMILSEQRRAVEKKVRKKVDQEKDQIKKEMSHKHMKSQRELQEEIHKKDDVIKEQEEVIEDVIKPKK